MASRIAHELHHDYLRAAYSAPLKKISPMALRAIDGSAPEEYIKEANTVMCFVTAKAQAAGLLAAADEVGKE